MRAPFELHATYGRIVDEGSGVGGGGSGEAEWSVPYLLHGAMDDYTSWTRETDVADLTAKLDLLVIMPEAGEWGFYSDWWNGGEGGSPMWETFHLTEVRELLERNWQAGEDRAVAGLAMGGFGAMSHAARHGTRRMASPLSSPAKSYAPETDFARSRRSPPRRRASAASSLWSGLCQKQNGTSRIGVARQRRPLGRSCVQV